MYEIKDEMSVYTALELFRASNATILPQINGGRVLQHSSRVVSGIDDVCLRVCGV